MRFHAGNPFSFDDHIGVRDQVTRDDVHHSDVFDDDLG
jgi:hypothetical protein